MKRKTRKQRTAIRKGLISLAIGLIIGIAYFCKFFPLDPIANIGILTVWSYTGCMFASLAILYGFCEIFITGEL